MSNTGLSEIDGKGSPPQQSLTSLFDGGSGSFTLPAIDRQTIDVKSQKTKLLRKVMYPKLCAKIEASGFVYETNMEENSWALLEASVVPSTRTSSLINITRQLDNKGKEWIWYSTVEKGYGLDGLEVPGSGTVVEHNRDFDIEIKKLLNSEGEVTRLQLTNKTTDIFIEEYSKEKVQDILNQYQISPKLGFSICEPSGKSWSGMNMMEFVELDSKELIYRCKNNKVNEDLTVRYTDLTSAQKLALTPKQ